MVSNSNSRVVQLTLDDRLEISPTLFSVRLTVPRKWYAKQIFVLVMAFVSRLKDKRGADLSASDLEVFIAGESVSLKRSVEEALCGISNVHVRRRPSPMSARREMLHRGETTHVQAIVESMAAVHETSVSATAAMLGLSKYQTCESLRRALLCHGWAACATVLPLLGEGIETAHLTSARQAYRCSLTSGLGHEASREALHRKAVRLVSASCAAARRLAARPGGREVLSATGVFPYLWEPGTMEAQLAESESILAGRVAKEAIRLELSRQRQMTPAKSLRTMTAARIVQGHSDAALGLAEKGFCILEDVLSTSDCRVLYNHFNSALQRGELFGPVSSDACNNGSFSLSIPTMAGAGPEPDSNVIKREIGRHPVKKEAFAKAFALRSALRALVGLPAELMDRLNCKGGRALVSVNVPPTVMCACYPAFTGACYYKHKDWYPYETSNHRDLTIVLYPNIGWTEEDGGELIIHGADGAIEVIGPLAGRAVVFFSRTIWHEVRPTNTRSRFAFTIWLDRAPQGK